VNPKLKWELVEVLEDRVDVTRVEGGGEHGSSGVLDVLKLIEDFVRCFIEDADAVIWSGSHEGMD
jgi:hypothetical protein